MARVYYTMETVEKLRALLRAMPPRLPIRRKGVSTDAQVALSSQVLQMKMAGLRIPEIQADLKARGFSIGVEKIRTYLRHCRAHGRSMRDVAAQTEAARTSDRDPGTRSGAKRARKMWS